jgi:hypothetical protein
MVEFIKETHQYLVDGILVPSVSTILKHTIFADKYKEVPDHILKNAAAFGTAVHEAIENDDTLFLDEQQRKVYDEWKRLQQEENIVPIKQEQIVHFDKEYAGTFDMIAEIQGEKCLVDIKTTYNLDIEYLSWQLSMYALAYGHQGKIYAVWLPKRKNAQLVEIPSKTYFQIHELLEAYYALHKDTDDIHSEW